LIVSDGIKQNFRRRRKPNPRRFEDAPTRHQMTHA
jgi:hypothetical protein